MAFSHKTLRRLYVEDCRTVEWQVEKLRNTLIFWNDGHEYDDIIHVLDNVSTLLFDDVYKALRVAWSEMI